MNIGMYQSAASLTALERWQDAVAQNITASQVNGFKKRTVEFSAMPMGEISTGAEKGTEELSGMMPKASYGISFTAGETTPTGRNLDVALQGEGFFKIQTASGQPIYTRTGQFQLSPERTLVTSDGSPVLSENGAPITALAQAGDIAIATDGTVSQGDTQLGKIGVFRFANNSVLTPIGGGAFDAGTATPTTVEKPNVLQGYLESSNVTPLREMVALVQIARAYEANQKIITSRDQTMQRALETLG